MTGNGEKRFIPGTNPEWGRELPDGYDNSLVDKAGNNWDNGFNFDEKDDDPEETTFGNLAEKVEFNAESPSESESPSEPESPSGSESPSEPESSPESESSSESEQTP